MHGLAPAAARLQRNDGAAELGLAAAGGVTRLAKLYQRAPCRILFPDAEADDAFLAVLLTTSGGLVGGDRLALRIAAGANAKALVTTQAAERVYRSLGDDSVIDVAVSAGPASWLEWMPQETILFDRARLVRRTEIDLADDARLLAGEIVVFGRRAMGERFADGFLHDAWSVRRGGKLVWADRLRLDGDAAALLAHPAGFGGATAHAMLLYCAADAPRWLDTARIFLKDGSSRSGATLVNSALVARFLAAEAEAVRRDVARYWSGMRSALAGLPARLPRVWRC
jgi:urease accessory protein